MKLTSLLQSFLIFSLFLGSATAVAQASETRGTIIGGGDKGYAWSDQAGWIHFAAQGGNIVIADPRITGYAWNGNYGWINMSPTNGGVLVAANGALTGHAWGSNMGWINFSGVSINSSGKFTGTATGAIVGTLTFDCVYCNVETDWRPVSVRSSVGAVILPPNAPAIAPNAPTSSPELSTPSLNTDTANVSTCDYDPLSAPTPDITRDGRVDIADFNQLMVQWGSSGKSEADSTRDCIVDIFDFNALMVAWTE